MSYLKSLITEKSKNQNTDENQEKLPPINYKKKGTKTISFSDVIKSNNSKEKFNSPKEALGEIYKLLTLINKERFQESKIKQNDTEKQNKQIIQALTGRRKYGMKTQLIKSSKSPKSFVSSALKILGIVSTISLVTSVASAATELSKIKLPEVKLPEVKLPTSLDDVKKLADQFNIVTDLKEDIEMIEGMKFEDWKEDGKNSYKEIVDYLNEIGEDVSSIVPNTQLERDVDQKISQPAKPIYGRDEHVFTGPMVPIKEAKDTTIDDRRKAEAEYQNRYEQDVMQGQKDANENVRKSEAEKQRIASIQAENKRKAEAENKRKAEAEYQNRYEQDVIRGQKDAAERQRNEAIEAENRRKIENRRKAEAEYQNRYEQDVVQGQLQSERNRRERERAESERQRIQEKIANRRDEESYENQTLQKVSAPVPIIPNRNNQGEVIQTNQQQRQEPPQVVGVDSARQIYAIGDSHADLGGLSSHQKIINRANGGLASTHPNNYSGKHTIRKTEVGLNTIPPNQIVFISQGANDTANAMKSYLDKMKLYREGKIKVEPKLPPASIIAQNVAKLVGAAKERGHIPVFLLFPNGPGRGRLPGHPPIAEYYGGDYQEEVRNAIRAAVGSLGVPIVDAQGLDLYDGIHARSYASVAKKMVEIARQKEKELTSKTIKTSSVLMNNVQDDKNNPLIHPLLYPSSNLSSLDNMPFQMQDYSAQMSESLKENFKGGRLHNQQFDHLHDTSPMIRKMRELVEIKMG
jgi:hypothetical protein